MKEVNVTDSSAALIPRPAPSDMGYHMPAEWAPHEATWFSWPHNPDTWGRRLASVERALATAVACLVRGEAVYINVLDEAHENHVWQVLKEAGISDRVSFFHHPTNDSWCRDHGGIFLVSPGKEGRLVVDWAYNAWGEKYPPFDLDNAIPEQMANALSLPHQSVSVVLEGGSIEVNGNGLLLTTKTCLLNPNRNPGLTQEQIEEVLKGVLGVEQIMWLGGELVGDDTDGHIDNLARFVNPDTVVMPVEENSADENSASLKANFELFSRQADEYGLKVKALPMPAPYFLDGHRMPANYANFYIGNSVVLVPAFDDPRDERARTLLQQYFTDREVLPIDCRDIIWGLGALHCLTQQVPA